ncbi:glycosyltransferase involved in cell wall biosynthesis [Paenibacillus rhizosphaerae]|uniref:Glycosyltransferase involved in cell wall biosynthesis n=1 Tax=Paenibacillus rhizosphaerae TaxID=297318 RepID=A0A839THQ1_9BACL|nr:glycosyltransferase family 4 protein [Paenibacillus rhizosphaerae]MBB3126335.1 glycosyltransferase involved in cell wall biosynthesis [Paenibacillus rhizosphaerae]
MIQQHHPFLDIMSAKQLEESIRDKGSEALNREYSRISAMCLGLAAFAIFKHIRIDSSAAVSYYYFSKNYDTFREWADKPEPDSDFLRLVIPRIGSIGAMNLKLTECLKAMAPSASVRHIGHFVDHALFHPVSADVDLQERKDGPLVIGWAGDPGKASKRYAALYEPIKKHFSSRLDVLFVETAGAYAHEDMPRFYRDIDLLLITSANEGGGATALEAFASGKPVLSTNVGYVKEAAHPSGHHLILDSDDPGAFIQAIDSCLQERSRLREIGRLCRAEIETHWTIELGVKRWLAVLFGI